MNTEAQEAAAEQPSQASAPGETIDNGPGTIDQISPTADHEPQTVPAGNEPQLKILHPESPNSNDSSESSDLSYPSDPEAEPTATTTAVPATDNRQGTSAHSLPPTNHQLQTGPVPTTDNGQLTTGKTETKNLQTQGHLTSRGRIPKVALLPLDIREFINEQLLFGTPPCIITEALEEKGYSGFSSRNINTWKVGGFQVWLRAGQTQAQLAAQRQAALTYAQKTGSRPDEALYQLSLHNLFEASSQLDLPAVVGNAKDKAALFCRLNADAVRLLRVGAGLKKSSPQPAVNSRLSAPWEEPADSCLRKGGLTLEERSLADLRLGIIPDDTKSPAPSIAAEPSPGPEKSNP